MVSSYLWISIAVGLAQVADCALHLSRKGRPTATGWVFSAVEFIWGFVSLYVATKNQTEVPVWLPLSFVAYIVGWTGYAVVNVKRHPDVKHISLTPKEVLVGGAFGAVFSTVSLLHAL